MTIEDACAAIMGRDLADKIIVDQGLPWAVVAAMCQATTDDDPEALAAINKWNESQRDEAPR